MFKDICPAFIHSYIYSVVDRIDKVRIMFKEIFLMNFEGELMRKVVQWP